MKPTIEECSTYIRHVNVAMRSEQPVSVGLAFDIAQSAIAARTTESDYRGRRAGTRVTAANTVESIPNSTPESVIPTLPEIEKSDGD